MVSFLNCAYNIFHLIPEEFVFLVPIFNRIGIAISCVLFVLSLPAFFTFVEKQFNNTECENSDKMKDEGNTESFNLGKGISRLTLPMYITNFLVIRFLYFTSRQPMSFDPLSLVRIVLSNVFVLASQSFPACSCHFHSAWLTQLNVASLDLDSCVVRDAYTFSLHPPGHQDLVNPHFDRYFFTLCSTFPSLSSRVCSQVFHWWPNAKKEAHQLSWPRLNVPESKLNQSMNNIRLHF